MAGRRIPRLNEQLKREITEILKTHVRDPRIGFVTVTDALSAPDLSHAKVFVSVLGDGDDKDASLEGLRAAAPFIRAELGKRMHVRRVPELHFQLDRALEHAMRIERLLSEVKQGEIGEGEGVGEGEIGEGE